MRRSFTTRRQFLQQAAAMAAVPVLVHTSGTAMAGNTIDNPLTVTPEESDEVLVNPGIGIETFWSFQGDRLHYDREVENYPQSSIAYFRYYWNELEEAEGQYNFEEIDFLLKKARKRGQDLALRFMGFNFGMRYPKYLMERARGHHVELAPHPWYPVPKVPTWAPDFNCPYFLSRLEAFLAAFGERYNGHPELVRLDIGSMGRWGEWHCSGLKEVAMPTEENACRLIDWHLKYFSKTPLSMLIGYVPGLRYAVSKGTGWRADSLGDWLRGKHMDKLYPPRLEQADALLAYRRGPVTFEPQIGMDDLVKTVIEKGHTYDEMWDIALKWGGSSFNAKSTPVPPDQVPSIERFLKRCGYRFVLRRFTTSRRASLSSGLRVQMEFENVGVAPPYKNYVLALRLKGQDSQVIVDTDAQVTQWLAGRHVVDARLAIPAGLKAGPCEVSVGLLDPHYRQPEVRLAIKGPIDNGWYPLGKVDLVG